MTITRRSAATTTGSSSSPGGTSTSSPTGPSAGPPIRTRHIRTRLHHRTHPVPDLDRIYRIYRACGQGEEGVSQQQDADSVPGDAAHSQGCGENRWAVGPQSTGQRARWLICVRKRSLPVGKDFLDSGRM